MRRVDGKGAEGGDDGADGLGCAGRVVWAFFHGVEDGRWISAGETEGQGWQFSVKVRRHGLWDDD